jgi:protein CpxP
MDIFTKNRATVTTIILLIVINVFTLLIIWFDGRGIFHPPRMEPPRENADRVAFFLKNELGLNEAQVQEYRQLRQKHLEQTRDINDEIHHLKKQLLDQLFSDRVDSEKVNKLIQSIGEKQKIAERITFNHFLEMKNLCGQGQQEKLHRLLDEFFRPPRPQGPPEMENDRPKPPPPHRGPNDQF